MQELVLKASICDRNTSRAIGTPMISSIDGTGAGDRPSFYFNFQRPAWSPVLNEEEHWIPTIRNFADEDSLELIYGRALDIMCARLQSEVCRNARAELHQRKNLHKFVQRRTDVPVSFRLVEYEILPKNIDDIFKRQQVQEEIDALILQDVCSLTPELEREHAKLVKRLQEYEETLPISSDMCGFGPIHSIQALKVRKKSIIV